MLCYSKQINKNFALEINIFHVYRSLMDGLSVFELQLDSDWYRGDHKPEFEFHLIILNMTIFEINLHNVNHVPDEEDESKE